MREMTKHENDPVVHLETELSKAFATLQQWSDSIECRVSTFQVLALEEAHARTVIEVHHGFGLVHRHRALQSVACLF